MTLKIKNLKYAASFCFIAPALFSFVWTLVYDAQYWVRDLVILLVLSSPLLVNRRLFYLFFGLVAAIISLSVFFIFAFTNTPSHTNEPFLFYLLGLVLYLLVFLASLAMIYLGTYTTEKGKFRLI